MIPLPAAFAAYYLTAEGWAVLAAMTFLAAFGQRISDHRTHRGNQ